LIFGERMSAMEIVGGALVLAGVWIVGRKEKADVPQLEEAIPPVAQI